DEVAQATEAEESSGPAYKRHKVPMFLEPCWFEIRANLSAGFESVLLERTACLLPINFPKPDWLLAVLHRNRIARLQLVTTVRRLRRRIANQNLSATRIRLQP